MTYKTDPGPGKYRGCDSPEGCPSCGGKGWKKKFFGGRRECYDCYGTGRKDASPPWKQHDYDETGGGDPDCDHRYPMGGHEFDPKSCAKCGHKSYR